MRESVDAVIIGGGIAGASAAYFLAKEGVRDIVVLERTAVAAGASGRASGLVSFVTAGHPGMTAILKASSDLYNSWEAEIGGAPVLNRVGALALVPPAERGEIERQVTVMREAGHDIRLLTGQSLREMVPGWDLDDIDTGMYSPTSGFIDPPMVTTALMNKARSMGVRVYQGAEVSEIMIDDGRAMGVRSNRADIITPMVILAAGAWTAEVARLAGADLPIWPVRHQVMHLKPPAGVVWPFPGTVDPTNSVYFRPEAGGLILAANAGPDDYPDEPAGLAEDFDPTTSPWYAAWIQQHLSRRIPAMADAQIVGGHAGAYPKGPDDYPLLGPLPQAKGLWCLCDTAGGGMTSSPGLGQALAETIVRGSTFTDIQPFRPARFANGAVVPGPYRLAHAGVPPSWDIAAQPRT